MSLAYVKRVNVLFWYPMSAILDCFFYLQLQKITYINLLTYTGPSPGPLPSPAMELTGEDGREVWEADGDLSNSSSWWDDASSDGRCGGVGIGGAFFLEEDFFAGFLGDFFPLPRPRPLSAIRRIWWDWSKGMISIYNNAVVDCRDTVEEWWERRLPTSFYTLWIDVMR